VVPQAPIPTHRADVLSNNQSPQIEDYPALRPAMLGGVPAPLTFRVLLRTTSALPSDGESVARKALRQMAPFPESPSVVSIADLHHPLNPIQQHPRRTTISSL
jgi:hypothetical protein